IPELAEGLALRAKDNGHTNIEVVAEAIGSREGRATFSLVKGALAYSGLRLRDDLPSGLETSVAAIEVTVTTLDSLLANSQRRVRLVKMDLEGGEYHALQGAASILKDHRPPVVFERGGRACRKMVWLHARRLVCPIRTCRPRRIRSFRNAFGPRALGLQYPLV